MSITRATFEDIIERIHTIPSLPEVVTRVVKLVNDPDSNANQVGEIMVKDVGMAAKILRMVNSVYFGLSEPVHDLDQAIVILGFKTIRSIALSISVINMFQQQSTGFNMKAFWTHCSVSACICRLIAEKVGRIDPELGFVVGLLKSIGVILLVEHAPEEMRAILAVSREYRTNLYKAERKVIATDHMQLGAWLCEKWGLEDEIVETIGRQYDLAEAGDNKVIPVCHFADYLCGLKRIRLTGDCHEPVLDQSIWHYLGLNKNALVEVLAVINDEVDRAKEMLRLAS